MAQMRDDVSFEDLVAFTMMIHKMRPDLEDKIVLQIQKIREGDKSLVFHLYDRLKNENDVSRQDAESTVVIISFELILDFFGIKENPFLTTET
jgi:hypothetical protein